MIPDIYIQLAVALGLGLLVGLQRERVDSVIAGIRTFALISLLGAISAQLAKTYGGWILVVGFLAKDGASRANGRDITFPDGKKLFVGSSGTGAPRDGRDSTEK